MSLDAADRRTTAWAGVVVVAFLALHLPFLADKFARNAWLYADGAFYFKTVQAIAEHGQLEQKALQPASWYEQDLRWNRNLDDAWSNVALGRNGGWYPKHIILLPAFSVPFYWLYGPVGTLVANVLLNVALAVIVFLLARRVARVELAALATIAVFAMPMTKKLSWSFSNDLLGAVLVLGAMELVLASRAGWAGILTGLALWSRVTNAAFLPALVILGWSQGGWRTVARAAGFSLVPLGVWGALNTWMFGAPWVTTYQRVIVREHGVMQTASHTRLFTVPFLRGLERVVLGKDGAFRSFWLLAPGVLGALVLTVRRRATGIALLLFVALPLLAFAKYHWYRASFLYPVFVLSAVGLAGLADLVWRRPPELPVGRLRVYRPRLVGAVALVLIASSALAVRSSQHRDPRLLSTHLEQAKVFLDTVPCDYFNPQNERWECARLDRGGWMMTGRLLRNEVTLRGVPFEGLLMHPSTTRKWRRIVFDELPGQSVELTFALGDRTRAGSVQVEVSARGQDPVTFELGKAGDTKTLTLSWTDGPGPALAIRTRADSPDWKHLVFEGVLSERPAATHDLRAAP